MNIKIEMKGKGTNSIIKSFGVSTNDIADLMSRILTSKAGSLTESFMETVKEDDGNVIAAMTCMFIAKAMIHGKKEKDE